jgi:hypothetical protein
MPRPLHGKDGFFKYYTAASAKLTLRNGTRKWSIPFEFNDPFDNQFDLHFEDPSEALATENANAFHKIITSPEPLKDDQFGELTSVVEFIRQTLLANPEFRFSEDELAEIREGELEGMQRVDAISADVNEGIRGVMADTTLFCLSEVHDSLLMWSHYAQNHTGAVIKFLSLEEVDSPLIVARPVHYSPELPQLRFADLMDFEGMKRVVYDTLTLCKSDVWSYEQEWRIVAGLRDKKKTYEFLPFALEEVGAVYLGCKMAPADWEEIIEIVRSKYPRAKVFQAHKHPREFALLFSEIE